MSGINAKITIIVDGGISDIVFKDYIEVIFNVVFNIVQPCG